MPFKGILLPQLQKIPRRRAKESHEPTGSQRAGNAHAVCFDPDGRFEAMYSNIPNRSNCPQGLPGSGLRVWSFRVYGFSTFQCLRKRWRRWSGYLSSLERVFGLGEGRQLIDKPSFLKGPNMKMDP